MVGELALFFNGNLLSEPGARLVCRKVLPLRRGTRNGPRDAKLFWGIDDDFSFHFVVQTAFKKQWYIIDDGLVIFDGGDTACEFSLNKGMHNFIEPRRLRSVGKHHCRERRPVEPAVAQKQRLTAQGPKSRHELLLNFVIIWRTGFNDLARNAIRVEHNHAPLGKQLCSRRFAAAHDSRQAIDTGIRIFHAVNAGPRNAADSPKAGR